MAHEHSITRRVEFAETDMAGVMHFSNFFRHMEAAEHSFFESLGLSLHENTADGGSRGWVRARATCEYLSPLRYRDVVEVRLTVAAKGSKSMTYRFAFHRANASMTEEVARGEITVVFVVREARELDWSTARIPADVAEAISAAPGSAL